MFIDPWVIVAAQAAIMAAGLVWAIVRERHLVDLNREQTQATQGIAHTIDTSAITFRMSLESLGELVRTLERQVERSGELSDKHREEFIRLALDIEIRIGNLFRDLLKQQPAIVNQVSTGQAAANQAGEIRNE